MEQQWDLEAALGARTRWALGLALGLGLFLAPGCVAPPAPGPVDGSVPEEPADAGAPDAGEVPDAGGPPDAGAPVDGGTSCDVAWHGDFQGGTALADEALGLAVDAQQHLLLVGYRAGGTAENILPSGNAQAVVRRLTPAGALAWERVLDTPEADTAEAVVPKGDGLYVVGRTRGAFPDLLSRGSFDLYVARLAADTGAGEVLVQEGTARPQHPRRAVLDSVGGLQVVGWEDTYVVGSAVYAWEDELSARLVPHAALGLLLERYAVSATGGQDVLTAVVADPDEADVSYVAGERWGGAAEGPFVRRVRAGGTVEWERRLTTVAVDSARGLAITPDGRLLVAGATFTSVGGRSFGQMDAYVLALDRANGEQLWGTQAGSEETDWVTDLVVDARGGFAVVGETPGDMTGRGAAQGGYDMFAVRFGPDGQVLETWQRGTPGDDTPHAAAVDGCGRLFVAGTTDGALVPGGQQGGRDMVLLQVDTTSPAR